jgi:hypothetical protein
MKKQVVVAVAAVFVVSGLFGCHQNSQPKAQVEADERQRVEVERQNADDGRQHVEEAEQQRLMQPQIDWVKSNLDGHDWSHFADYSNGTRFNEMEHVTADVGHRCSINLLERRVNDFGFFKKECTVNLTSFPRSGVSIEKVNQNNTILEGIRMNTLPYWSVKFEDAKRISCTDTFAGQSSDSSEIDINFESAAEAKQMVNTFIRMTGDSCAK